MGYRKFSKRPQDNHQTLGALGGLGGLHPQTSKTQTAGEEAQIVTLTPPKAPKPPKVLASVPSAFPFAAALDELERRRPEFIEAERWQRCLLDAQHFLGEWGDKALALGWSDRELFGLHDPPTQPQPSYSRLSRYDCTGLLWLLQGRRVVALAADTAAIETASGIVVYRKHRKPAYGPLGDSLDDFSGGDPPEAA